MLHQSQKISGSPSLSSSLHTSHTALCSSTCCDAEPKRSSDGTAMSEAVERLDDLDVALEREDTMDEDTMEFVEQFEVQGVKGKSSALSRLMLLACTLTPRQTQRCLPPYTA
mgnify:CR=1 FL=1